MALCDEALPGNQCLRSSVARVDAWGSGGPLSRPALPWDMGGSPTLCILASRLYQFVLWRDLLCQSCQCSSVPLPFMTAQREKYIQWGISESLLRGVNNPGLRGGDTLSQCLLRTYATSTVLGTVGETEQALNSVELITKHSGVQRS